MKVRVTISTDSLLICEAREVEGRSTMEGLLAALHHETSAYQHLRDLPSASLHIEVWAESRSLMPLTLNQEANGKA